MNHKRAARIMRENNLLAVQPRAFILTAHSQHKLEVYRNLASGMKLTGINQLCVDLSRRLAKLHAENHYNYIAATVFGRPDAAAAGRLFIFSARPSEPIEKCRSLLAMGLKTFMINENVPAANLIKLCGNFLTTTVIESLAEAFTLVWKVGVDPQKFLEVLTESIFSTSVYKSYGAMSAADKFEPVGFKLSLGFKNNRLLQAAAEEASVPMPIVRLLCVAMLIGLQSVSLQGQSHVSEPAVNLGDTSFLDGPAGPGFVAEQIGDAAYDGKITNSAGNAVPGAGAVNSISSLTHIAWLSHKQVLGGWCGVEVVLSAAHVNAGDLGEAGGLGNTTVAPLILQWPEHRVLGMAIDQRVTADFDLPTGQYSRTSAVNISSNAFTVHPYYSITVFPKKRIETSWRVHYLWNSINNDPPISTGAQSTQAGQAIHFNATAAYNAYKGLWIGPNAYYLKQITDGKIDGLSLQNSPEQVGAIGPGGVWNHKKWFFYANGYQEFAAHNRATGHKLVLRIEKTF